MRTGTLPGHALPGSIFIIVAIWRLVQIVRRVQLIALQQRNGRTSAKFFTSATYPCCIGWCARWPVEGMTWVGLTTFGMATQLWASTNYGRAGKIVDLGDIEHLAMLFMFFLSGIVQILRYCQIRYIPPGLDFLSQALALAGEWVLVSYHFHGRSPLDVLLHKLLLYITAATIMSILAELKFNQSLLAALSTTYLMFVQGTWWFQIGFMLYPPSPAYPTWEENAENSLMMTTTMFNCHLGGGLSLMLGAYVGLSYIFDRLFTPSHPETWEMRVFDRDAAVNLFVATEINSSDQEMEPIVTTV